MKISIVTGASSGMGRQFARMLDKIDECDEIWVIARRIERLTELSGELSTKVRPICADLSKEDSYTLIGDMLLNEKEKNDDFYVETLVNAAGYGKFGNFTELSLPEQLGMIDLNLRALVAITHIVLPYMTKGSKVYQLGSLSSFQPVPYIGVYGATKAAVLSFTRAVNKELENKGIKMIAVCPGWVATEFFDRAVKDDTITYYNKFFTADEVIRCAVKDLYKGKDVSVCGISVRAQVLLTKLLPHKLVMNIWCRQQKK